MNYLTLDLDNGDLVLSDNSVWKSLNTWLDGGTLYSDYYDASNCGDFWVASTHWISIDSESTYLTFTIEYEFIDATATDSCLCQIKFDGFEDGGVAVTADSSGLNISTDASKHINCDYSNANIKIDITVNFLTKEITTYIHKDNEPLAKKVNVSNYSFTEFIIQAGSRGDIVYKLPTTTKLLNVSVSDVAVSYSNFPETIDYIDKLGLARIWANIKSYISSQLLGKSDTGHTHVSSDVTDLLSNTHTWTSQQSYNSDLNLNYASTDIDDIVNSVAGSATLDNFVHMTGNETVSGIKSFPDGVIANVTGSATSATNDGSGNVISTTYGKLGATNVWTNVNSFIDNHPRFKSSEMTLGTIPQSDKYVGLFFNDSNDRLLGSIDYHFDYSGNSSFETRLTRNNSGASRTLVFGITLPQSGTGDAKYNTNVRPFSNNNFDLGSSSYKWKSIWFNNLQDIATDTVEWHNSHYRGINLISEGHFANMAALLTAIRAQDWSDIYIGDYVELTFTYEGASRTVKFYVGEIDKFYKVGNVTSVSSHHLVMVTGYLGINQKMNDTTTTAGGYVGSKAHMTILPALYNIINPLFNNAILSQNFWLSNAVTTSQSVSLSLDDGNGATSYTCDNFPVYSGNIPHVQGCVTDGTWVDCNLMLMSEVEMFGCSRFSSSAYEDLMCPEGQIAVFKYYRDLQTFVRTAPTWLRNISCDGQFSCVRGPGYVNGNPANGTSCQMRPRFLIG